MSPQQRRAMLVGLELDRLNALAAQPGRQTPALDLYRRRLRGLLADALEATEDA